MEGSERIISERVVSRRVIGSANPIARGFRKVKGSFGGICIAPIFFLISFILIYSSEKIEKNSRVVESLSLESVNEVTYNEGLHKVNGKVSITTSAQAPQIGDVLYYSSRKEQYQEVEETEMETITTIENGEEIEEEIERIKIVEKWVEMEADSQWAEFKLGAYTVNPNGADLKVDYLEKEYREENGLYTELKSSQSLSPEVGDYRLVVNYLPIDTDLLIVGEFGTNTIDKGELFIITTKGNDELINDMKTAETTTYWVMKGVSWLLLTFGFLMLLSPILTLLDFIPIAGKAVSCVASIIAAVISLGIVLLATIIIKFWWLFIILSGLFIIGLIILLVVLIFKKKPEDEINKESKESQADGNLK